MLGYLRLLTNHKVMGGSTTTLARALQLYDRWTEDPPVELAPEPRGAETLFRQAAVPYALQPATKAIADCYLVGFREAAAAHLVTFDKGLAATAQFRHVPVALPEAVDSRATVVPRAKTKHPRRAENSRNPRSGTRQSAAWTMWPPYKPPPTA